MSRPDPAKTLSRLVVAALGLVLASPLYAYVIVLKDGSKIIAKEKPTVQGDRLVFVTRIGTAQSLPISDLDKKATDETNKLVGNGDAIVVDTPDGKGAVQQMDGKRRPTLSEYIKTNRETNLVMKESAAAQAPRAAADAGVSHAAEKAAAAGESSLDPATNDAFLRALEASGIRGPRLSGVAHGVRVQAVADTEQQVFAAIGACARGLKEARAAGKPLDKAELWLVTTNGQNAGKFEMAAEDADALLNGKIGAAKYFVANVIF
jgi:hypothetical protein